VAGDVTAASPVDTRQAPVGDGGPGVPSFGVRLAGVTYRPRASAYALVHDAAGALAVVRTPQGCFLPGGGAEPGEAAAETIAREVAEETGLRVVPGAVVGEAVELVYAAAERTGYEKRSTFTVAPVVSAGGAGGATEPDHHLEWHSPLCAAALLTPESHRWAVARWRAIAAAEPGPGADTRRAAPT
jgi:8-oxo-dGTP diphosphatase